MQSQRLGGLSQAAHAVGFLSDFAQQHPCCPSKPGRPFCSYSEHTSSIRPSLIAPAPINLAHLWNSLTHMGLHASLHSISPSLTIVLCSLPVHSVIFAPSGVSSHCDHHLPREIHIPESSPNVNFQCSAHFSRSVVSSSLQSHGLQHARPPCPSPTPGVYSNSCPLELVMPSNHLILCCPLFLTPSVFPSIRVFSNELVLCIRWPKYWSFSFNNQSFKWIFRTNFFYDGLVGSPCSPRDSQASFSTSQFKTINSSVLSFLYSPTLTHIHDYWKNHSLD